MSIEGSINVSALFHDRDGTTAMKVVSLRSSDEYTTGKVAIVTGTAGTAQTSIAIGDVYRDAAGELVSLIPTRVAFAWSNVNSRLLESNDGAGTIGFLLRSRGGEVATTTHGGPTNLVLRQGSNTGTYTIVLYGTE